MTADQQSADSFDREWQHALATALPARPALSDHPAVLKHRRCEHQLQELLQYYSRKLPAFLYAPRLLAAGAQLQEREDYRLAAELCFQRLADMALPTSPDSSGKLDAASRLGLHVQALYGLHSCQAAEALLRDPHLLHQHTQSAALAGLAGLQAACQMVIPAQPLLVLLGTQHIHKLAARLLKAGLHAQVLPHLLFAAQAMECHISLSAPQHLPWRVQLYAAVAECYCVQLSRSQTGAAAAAAAAAGTAQQQPSPPSCGTHDTPLTAATAPAADTAREVLAAGLAHLASIARAQALDAVPAPDVIAAVQAAQAQLTLLQALFQQETHPPATGTGAEQPPTASTASQLLAGLKAIGSSQEQLAALVRLLQSGLAAQASPLHRVQLPSNLQVVVQAAAELAAAVLPGLGAPAGSEAHSTAGAAAGPGAADLHRELLVVAYQYQQPELLQKLLSAVLSPAADPAAAADQAPAAAQCPCLAAVAAVLDAVIKAHEAPGDAAMQQLAAVLATFSTALGSCAPSLLAEAALELHAAAGSVLEGCFSHADGSADLVQAVLEGLHAALEQCGVHTDGVLRGSIALRLAALLEEQQQLDRGLEVVGQGLAAITAARCEALTHLQGQDDEHLRWISGSRAQPDNATAALLEGMSDAEQVLACLHADSLMLQTRLQLKQGRREAAAKTAAHQQRLQATLQKRDQQADIFGARTRKERRLDAAAVEGAGRLPMTAPDVEQRLLLACGQCPYQRALVLTSIALVQPDVSRQAALLEEACDALHSAHEGEAELFASQQPGTEALRPLSAHHVRPVNPKVLCRTPNSTSLSAFPVKVAREARQPAAFAAYCKPCAAGVSLTVNKTTMEYPGSGVRVTIGGRVTVEGLQSNEAYKFAVAVFDDQGTLLGELGCSSPSIPMSLPLPVYYCYAHVLLAAAHLGLWTVAKRAAGVLFPRFFTATPARPLWEAHPAERFSTQAPQVAAQVPAFLRVLVQAVYAYAGHQASKHTAALAQAGSSSSSGAAADGGQEAEPGSSGLGGTAASRALLLSLSNSRLPQQVALLEAAQRHLLAMQVAAQAGDEMLVEEGALRTLNLLTPLLQQQDISPTLFKPLSELHRCLAAVQDTAASSIAGHKQQRQQAARALAAASFWKLRTLQPVGAVLACGSAAVAAHGVIGLELKPSAALAALDGALLRVLSGSSQAAAGPADGAAQDSSPSKAAAAGKAGAKKHVAGHKGGQKAAVSTSAAGPSSASVAFGAGAEQAKELVALQELLLWHPQGAAWAAGLHASRCEDPSDLVAQVLPKLEQPHALTTCWPLLSAPGAQSHPKWLPLCVLLMQAAAKQHGAALWLSLPPADTVRGTSGPSSTLVGVSADTLPPSAHPTASPQLTAAAATAVELLLTVKQAVRLAARRPQFLTWPDSPKWTVEAGAAALEAEGFALGDQDTAAAPPQPELPAGTAAAAKAAAMAAWQQETLELLVQERRRLAAVQLLQQRLPVLLGRRMAIVAARQQLAAWAPWLAQLHTLVGGMAAEAAAQLLSQSSPAGAGASHAAGVPSAQAQPGALAGSADNPVTARSTTAAAGDPAAVAAGADAAATPSAAAGATRPPSVAGSKPPSPRKSSTDSSRPQTAAQPTQGAAPAAATSPQVNAVVELAQVLAVQAHQQFAQAATLSARSSHHQQLFSVAKQLQGVSTYLLNRLPSLLNAVPAATWAVGPLPDPQVLPIPAAAPERPPADPAAGAGKGAAADKKGAAGGAATKAAAAATDKKVAASAGKAGKAGAPRADARHTLLPETPKPNVGVPLRAVAAALLAALQQLRSLSSKPSTACQSEARSGSVPTALEGGSTTARSYVSSFSFGSDAVVECWHTGGDLDVAGLTQLLVVVLKVLHKMQRWRCMLELGSAWLELCQGSADAVLVPLLLTAAQKAGSAADVAALQQAHKALAADRNIALDDLAKVRLRVAQHLHGLGPLDAATSSLSGPDAQLPDQGADTWTPAASQAALLPAEYERVVAQLKKRGEKGHMILALNELGDLHAHFGSFSKASEVWSSAVDALLGAYRVVEVWRTKLELGSNEQQLRRYGLHGLLLAATILGKLARYTYSGHLGSRLSCALLAAELLPAVFCGDIIHPQRRLDFAAYVPLEIWPGVDVFEDAYRCNAAHLGSSLQCLSSILQEHSLHLLSLPLLSLWEHTSLFITRNRTSTVLSRITRARALAALGLMPQAAAVLQGLMHGANLPGLVLGPPQPVLGANGLAVGLAADTATAKAGPKGHAAEGREGKEPPAAGNGEAGGDGDSWPQLFHADKWPGDAANATGFLQYVSEAVLDPAVAAAYGPWLCGHTTLARCAFLAAAGGAVNCWLSGKPAALALAVTSGPPQLPPAAHSTAASTEAVAAGAASAGAAAAAKGGKAAPGSGAAAPAAGKIADGKAAAAAAAAAATPSTPPPPARVPAEHKLLAAAAQLLQGVVSASCAAAGLSAAALGLPWGADSPSEPGKPAAAAKPGAKAAQGKDKTGSHGSTAKAAHSKAGKGGAKGKAGASKGHQQQSEQHEAGEDSAAAERQAAAAAELLAAQHQQLLVSALLQLAAVQAEAWLPLQALSVCLAACEAIKLAAGSSAWAADSHLDSHQAEAKASLLPSSSTWLAARTQLAKVLLQLHHHGPCISVCLKALTDAARAADVAWSAQLQGLQAVALVAQEEYLPALNCYRSALARLEQHRLPASLVLPLQLDYAALCDEVGACGDFDRLAGASLAASTAEMQDMGLAEMMEHPQLTTVYLPAAATHLAALLAAATAATRRRQLAAAERHLRAAATMLRCCRCSPVDAAAVLAGLARVLRLQAALKLPSTALLVAPKLPQQQLSETAAAVAAGSSGWSGNSTTGAQLQQNRLHEAAHLLGLALQVLVADAGSNPVLVRAALLELAAVTSQQQQPEHQQQPEQQRQQQQEQPGGDEAAELAAIAAATAVVAARVQASEGHCAGDTPGSSGQLLLPCAAADQGANAAAAVAAAEAHKAAHTAEAPGCVDAAAARVPAAAAATAAAVAAGAAAAAAAETRQQQQQRESPLLELPRLTQAAEQQRANTVICGTAAAPAADPAAAARVSAVLRAAHVTAGQVVKLLLESHSLQPVQSPSSCLPEWLLELLKGHEQLQQSLQQEAAAAAAAIAAGACSKAATAGRVSCSSSTLGASTAGKQAAEGAAGSAAATAVPDATLGRLTVCFFVKQLAAMASGAAGLQRRAAEQALLAQPVLRAACAKFAAGCCWTDVPPEVTAALNNLPMPALQAGSVIVQWYRQDGCWQVPSSWCCHGALPPGTKQLTCEALDSLPKQQPCVSCLYVLVLPAGCAAAVAAGPAAAAATAASSEGGAQQQPQGGAVAGHSSGPVVLQGELVVSLERAKRVQLQVKSVRSRLENPGKPTDLFAQPAPSTAELVAVKHSLECLLADVLEDSTPPPDLPPLLEPPQQQQTVVASATAAPGGSAAAGAKAAPAAATTAPAGSKPATAAKASATGSTASAAAAAAPLGGKASTAAAPAAQTGSAVGAAGGGSGSSEAAAVVPQLDWRQVETWAKAEMLLDLEGGLQLTDAAVAVWLGRLLQGGLQAA